MLKIIELDVGIDFVEFIKEHIGESKKRVVFIGANRRLLRFVERSLGVEQQLKCSFFSLEDFFKELFVKFAAFKQIHSKLQREIFFLDLIKGEFSELYKKLGNKDELVFVWAKRLSSLFNEIDRFMLADKLENYRYTESIEQAEVILSQIKLLYKKYDELYKDFGYNGRFYKFAEELGDKEDCLKSEFKDTLFIFSGIVYFTDSERLLIKRLLNIGDVELIFQLDLFGRDNVAKDKKQYDFESFKAVYDAVDTIKKDVKDYKIEEVKDKKEDVEIQLCEFTSRHSMAAFIKDELEEIRKDIDDLDNPNNIGVILPDSQSLFPILNAVEKDSLPINITMGYPFLNTDFGIFLKAFFELLMDISFREYNNSVSSRLLLDVLNSSLVNLFNSDIDIAAVKDEIFKSSSSVYEFAKESPFYDKLINPFLTAKNSKDFSDAFWALIKLFDDDKLNSRSNLFLVQMLNYFLREVVEPVGMLNRDMDFRFFYSVIMESLMDLSVPFEGHPLKGVQFMGMLEARLLKFKYLFICDVNEGVLPNKKVIDPLLPEDIRLAIGLDNFRKTQELMKYYFFRTVYSSKKVYLLYRVGSTLFERSSKSRFVEQLMLHHQIKNNILKPTKFESASIVMPDRGDGIERDEAMDNFINQRLNSFISPSELDDYMNCPYRYYLKRVKKIDKPIDLKGDYAADMVGRIVHHVFEKQFRGYVGKTVKKNEYKEIFNSIFDWIKQLDRNTEFDEDNVELSDYMKRLPNLQIDFLKTIVDTRIKALLNQTLSEYKEFKLLGVEVEKTYDVDKIKLKGRFDRLDSVSNDVRIVDYKTSLKIKKPKKSKFDSLDIDDKRFDRETLINVKDAVVSMQFPVYLLIEDKESINNNIYAEVYLLGSGKSSDIVETIRNIDLNKVKLIVKYLFNHMKSADKIYAIEGSNCQFCEYRHFCKFGE